MGQLRHRSQLPGSLEPCSFPQAMATLPAPVNGLVSPSQLNTVLINDLWDSKKIHHGHLDESAHVQNASCLYSYRLIVTCNHLDLQSSKNT